MKKLSILIAFALIASTFNTIFAADVTIFGPKKYVHDTSKPKKHKHHKGKQKKHAHHKDKHSDYYETFEALEGVGKLIIINGNDKGSKRVSSAEIEINGEKVLRKKDFNKKVDYLELDVNFTKQNNISIKLKSKRGSYLTIKVIQEDPNLTESTKILDILTQGNLKSISQDGSIYAFEGETEQLESLYPGDILVIGITEHTPNGALRMVTAIDEDNGKYIIETTQASLEDVVIEADIEATGILNPNSVQSTSAISTVSEASIMSIAEKEKFLQLDFSKILYDEDGDIETTTHDQVRAIGHLGLDLSYDFKLRIKNRKLQYLLFTQSLEEDSSLELQAEISVLSFEKKIKLAEYTLPRLKFMIGLLPIWVTPEFVLTLGADGTSSTQLKAGFRQTLSLSAGAEYFNNEWKTIKEIDNHFEPIGPDLSSSASLKAYLEPELGLKIYDIAGPSASVIGYEELKASFQDDDFDYYYSDKVWKLVAGIDANIAMEINIFFKNYSQYQSIDL